MCEGQRSVVTSRAIKKKCWMMRTYKSFASVSCFFADFKHFAFLLISNYRLRRSFVLFLKRSFFRRVDWKDTQETSVVGKIHRTTVHSSPASVWGRDACVVMSNAASRDDAGCCLARVSAARSGCACCCELVRTSRAEPHNQPPFVDVPSCAIKIAHQHPPSCDPFSSPPSSSSSASESSSNLRRSASRASSSS